IYYFILLFDIYFTYLLVFISYLFLVFVAHLPVQKRWVFKYFYYLNLIIYIAETFSIDICIIFLSLYHIISAIHYYYKKIIF
ncbi:MAG: hypothetical protein N7Q72_03525, partial [Spiroplasma sp. Tabriz.8]|nr:hypothetical protein [Spiroplasma sp. Tabriz.8]